VYAFRHELDEWLRLRSHELANDHDGPDDDPGAEEAGPGWGGAGDPAAPRPAPAAPGASGQAEERAASAPPASAGLRRSLGLPAAALVVMTVVLVSMRFGDRPAPPAGAVPSPRLLTTSPGIERLPALSPDGRQVTYVWDGDRGQIDVYIRLVGAGQSLRLTDDAAIEESPVWSPDGLSIAFLRQVGRGRRELRVVPALGGAERLVATLPVTVDLDVARNGLSNGGGMSFVLSCALADRIAAVGTVAAAHMLPFAWCADERPMPLINFHGTDDRVVPYEGGETWVAPVVFPDVEAWTARWADRNGCGPAAVESRVAADVTRREWVGCADGASVVLYTVQGGGHTWPGGEPLPEWFLGATSESVDATALMWEFFRHRRRRSPASGPGEARPGAG
jgi:polyhydroxybutyrate depolymerase